MATSKKRGQAAPRYDIPYVQSAAQSAGWPSIFAALAGINADTFDGRHGPCPKCGGTDRFRFLAEKGTGATICNQCNRNGCGDGLATLGWLTGWKFAECLARVAEHLGVEPLTDSAVSGVGHGPGKAKPPKADPAANLTWQPWNPVLAEMFCERKPPITPDGLLACGAKFARYRGQYTVIALPVWDQRAIAQGVTDGAVVGWSLWNITGGLLPNYVKDRDDDGFITEWLKVKLTAGTQSGLIGDPARIRAAKTLLKVEGPSDLAAIHSLADLPAEVAPITNANGAGELPKPWVVDLLTGKEVLVVHDADRPGQRGAVGWKDERGRLNDGWLQKLAGKAASVANLTLPYEVADTHGKDLRDYLSEGHGWAGVIALPRQVGGEGGSPPGVGSSDGPLGDGDGKQPVEADDDPHRLARVNLQKYEELTNGGKIVRWRGKWYTWKPSRGCYARIDEDELRARVAATAKAEFDRLNRADVEQAIADGKKPPEAKKVTRTLVTDIIHATASLVLLKSSLEPNSWIVPPNPLADESDRPHIVAMKSGLLDIGALVLGAKIEECQQPLTPNWFSFVRLPYGFESQARCPEWEAFLEKSMEGDVDRINRLQEWAGYLLIPDNSHQKFLALEGEGRNGKSVYLAGVTAMLGCENVSNIKLEDLGERFQVAGTMGKLANVCADTNEVDVRCEGFLKAFTAGDRIHVDLKYGDGVDFVPSARLMLAWNNRPRFSDKTDAIWRRILMVVWRYQVRQEEVILGMDTTAYWERSGELPGMFKWALDGLIRLREQGQFTYSKICDSVVNEFRDESNPARSFLREFVEEKPATDSRSAGRITTERLYHFYCCWCKSQGNRFPLGAEFFSREVYRLFGGKVKRIRPRSSVGEGSERPYAFEGIDFSCDEICGEKTGRDSLSGF